MNPERFIPEGPFVIYAADLGAARIHVPPIGALHPRADGFVVDQTELIPIKDGVFQLFVHYTQDSELASLGLGAYI